MAHILLAEDDESLRKFLAQHSCAPAMR